MLIARIIADPKKPATPYQIRAVAMAAVVNGSDELTTDTDRWAQFAKLVGEFKLFAKQQPGETVTLDSTYPRLYIEHTDAESDKKSVAVVSFV